jgi:hypothetical protein
MPVDATASCPQRENKRSQIQHDGIPQIQTNYNSKNTSLQTVIRLRFDGISENMHGKMNEAVPFKDFDVLNQTLGNLGD